VHEKEKKGWMGQQMINVEKTNNEGESETERVWKQDRQGERAWEGEEVVDGTTDDKCRENKPWGRKQDRQRERACEGEELMDGTTDVEKTKKKGESKTNR
jgi:hypothetical protein